MKVILCLTLILIAASSFSQDTSLVVSGRILDPDSYGISNAYIVNYRNMAVYSSKGDGHFSIRVAKGDSLIVNHISFIRKKIYADSILINPIIYLDFDTIMLKQVDFGPDPEKLQKNLEETMSFIREADKIVYKRMDPEMELSNKAMVENNNVLRSEASSVRMASFSPSQVVGQVFKGKRKINKQRGYNFYRDEAQKIRKEKRKQKAE